LDLLSNVLSEGKTSRLFQSLVYEQKLAKEVYAFQASQKLSSTYIIQATAAPGTDLDALAAAVQKEIELALENPPTEKEMSRARNEYKKGFFHRLETYESRASLLGSYFLHTGKGDYVREDYRRYLLPTPVDVQKAAKQYLDFNKVVRLDFIPGKKSTPVRKLSPKAAPSTKTKKEKTK
jgi:predicted Zn-dependent peptidase